MSTTPTGGRAPRSHKTDHPPLLCLSHLRWDFVYQRPQHLMTRFARDRRVIFWEEPVRDGDPERVETAETEQGVQVAVPHLAHGIEGPAADAAQRRLLDAHLAEEGVEDFVAWYYTPMALGFSDHLEPRATIFDSMDELTLFDFAPAELVERERALLERADVVFTGGASLYEAKRGRHPNVHCFPSSIDFHHFARARGRLPEPVDQRGILRPRIGFFGVVDERLDRDLIAAVADLRPDWQWVIVGPVVKIDPGDLPRRPNLHYLGAKKYADLPDYIAGWDIAAMPWARNDATRFISPTKTPECLAAGKPVVSTRIADVVRAYGDLGLARIVDTPAEWVREIEAILATPAPERKRWLAAVDDSLAATSWERTWSGMQLQIEALLNGGAAAEVAPASGGKEDDKQDRNQNRSYFSPREADSYRGSSSPLEVP